MGATPSSPSQVCALDRVRAAVTVLARLIGRRIAREQHDRCDAANDNAPAKDAGET